MRAPKILHRKHGAIGRVLLFVLGFLAAFSGRGQSFTLAVNDTQDSIQWQSSPDHVNWVDIAGGNVGSYVAHPAQTTYYRARVDAIGCQPVYSDIKAAVLYGDTLIGGRLLTGQLVLPAGTTLPLNTLVVNSILGESVVNPDGTFAINVLDTAAECVILVTNTAGQVTMMSHFIGPQKTVVIDAQSSASALLSLYPFLLPVDTGTEKQLLAEYLAQPEFPGLLSAVQSIIASGAPLLSPDNSSIASMVMTIMSKSYNNSRIVENAKKMLSRSSGAAATGRLRGARSFFGSSPIDITTNGSVVAVDNVTIANFAGGLYKASGGDTTLLQSFMLDGMFMKSNPILNVVVVGINSLLSVNGNATPNSQWSTDLRNYSGSPGTYLFRIRNGLTFDGSPEDDNGGNENTIELSAAFLGDLIKGEFPELVAIKDKCLQAFLNQLVSATRTAMKANPQTNFFTGILVPDVNSWVKADLKCGSTPFTKFFSSLLGVVQVYTDIVTGKLASPTFAASWLLTDPKVDGCKLLDKSGNPYNCFSFSATTPTQFDATTCDVISLGFQATENPQFYPYQGNPVPGVPFTWTTTQGDGTFAPTGQSTINAVTDDFGNATIQFTVPSAAAANTVAAIDNMNEAKPSAIVFYNAPATAMTYTAAASPNSQNLSGETGKQLSQALVISVTDENGSPVSLTKFNVTWNTNGNGSVTEIPALGSITQPTWLWTLGTTPGQQQIEATVESATCDWDIQGNPVVFTANAYGPIQITTNLPSAVGQDSAISGGDITSDGGSPIIKSGVCWGTGQNPDTTGLHSTDGTSTGSFSSVIRGLAPSQPYFVRAYAVNATGVYYGNSVGFNTLAITLPTVATQAVTDITATGATTGGTVTADGGSPVTARGICWSTISDPTLLNPNLPGGSGLGAFTLVLSGLSASTSYHARAFATNSVGTAYGPDQPFTTPAAGPTVTTTIYSNFIGDTTAWIYGTATGGNSADVLSRGVCWSTSSTPTVNDNSGTSGSGTGTYEVLVGLLQPATTYFASAYVTTSVGVQYGNVVTFTTTPATAPFVTGIPASNIGATTAQSGGTITSDGASPVTARGVCWGTAQNPTISGSKTSDGTGAGGFLSTMTGLAVGKTYYVRAYATNAIGTTYGTQMTFVARPDSLSVITAPVTSVTGASAICGGTVVNTGVYSLMTKGVCWSTAADPTTTVFYNSYNTAAGSFLSVVSPLQPSTTYYIRAYGADSLGNITYGNLETFTTGPTNPYTNFSGTFFADSACQVGVCILQTQNIGIAFQLDLTDPTLTGIWTDPYGTGIWPMTGTLSDLVTDYNDGNGYLPAHYFIEHRYELKGTLVGNTYSGTIISYATYITQEVDGTLDTSYGQQKGTFSVTKQ
jgi:hypothetical protein